MILTNGTFLNGIIHIGENSSGAVEQGKNLLPESLNNSLAWFQAGRMKTGTPPRVDGRTLDYSKMEVQNGDEKFNDSHLQIHLYLLLSYHVTSPTQVQMCMKV